MHNESHIIELDSAITPNEKLRLSTAGHNGHMLIEARISTRDYNVGVQVHPEKLHLAARSLFELPYALAHTARLRQVLDEVAAERARQNHLADIGEIPFTCADPDVSPGRKHAAITEEFLEVTREVQTINDSPDIAERDQARRNLRVEAIQLAAQCVALVESLQP